MKRYLLIIAFLALTVTSLIAQNGHGESDSNYRIALQYTGDAIQLALPAGALIMCYKKKDLKGFKQLVYGFTATVVVTQIGKNTIKKKRPGDTNEYNAFPSGHTSSSFHAAGFIYKRYGWQYGIPSLALATIVGYSRVSGVDERHHAIDVLGGAAIGSLAAILFTSKYTKGINLDVSMDRSTVGVSYSLKF